MGSRYSGSNLQGKRDIMNCCCYTAVKLLEHGMEVVEIVLQQRLHRIVTVEEMRFGFMSESGAIDTVFILRRLQEECSAKGQKYLCVLWT